MLITKSLINIILIAHVECKWRSNLKHKMRDYKQRAQEMYDQFGTNQSKVWEFGIGDPLSYPGQEPSKLQIITEQWLKYYECTEKQMKLLTPYKTLPHTSLMSYKGAVVYLMCNLCVSPDDGDKITWWFTQNLTKPTFGPMPETDTMILNEAKLTIYNLQNEDAGIYYCKIGDSMGGLILLEIINDDQDYNVVKPLSTNGPYSKGPVVLSQNLVMLSKWSNWSECSKCDHVGRRRRYGPCFVIMQETNETQTEMNDAVTVTDDLIYLLKVFPGGLACRSQYMPEYLRNNQILIERRDEIMIGLCKEPCDHDRMFEVHNSYGQVVERVNNTAGVYSLLQPLPPQPPAPARGIVFVPRLHSIHILCPGTTLRDMPVTWRVGGLNVVPRDLYESTSGRMFVSARDQLVITSVKYTDTNVYSCWQSGVLAGSVKLEVWKGQGTAWNDYVTLIAMLLVAAVCVRVAINVMNNKAKKMNLL